MANLFSILVNPTLTLLMKLLGLRSKTLELEPCTTIHFWAPPPSSTDPPPPAVVLLHGFSGNGTLTWFFQVLALARTYRVYVPDLLFFGGSVTGSGDRSPEFQAKCVAEGLRRLGVERCVAVGFSYGGFVGFRMAERYPKLVRGLVVSGALVALTESVSRAALGRLGFESWSECLLPTTVKGLRVLFDLGTHKMIPLPDWAYRHFIEAMFNNRRERGELLQALVHTDHTLTTPETPLYFSQNIYILVGDDDKIFNLDDIFHAKQQVGEKASVYIIKEAGHLAHLERPFAYNALLKSILANVNIEDDLYFK